MNKYLYLKYMYPFYQDALLCRVIKRGTIRGGEYDKYEIKKILKQPKGDDLQLFLPPYQPYFEDDKLCIELYREYPLSEILEFESDTDALLYIELTK